MATMALPISELAPVRIEAEKAQEVTQTVLRYSRSKVADLGTACKVFGKTVLLRHRFSVLVTKQSRLISKLQETDFSQPPLQSLEKLANNIDELVADEREILITANDFGAEIRVWWATYLQKLSDQVDHLGSISESLHAAADPECTALMAIAVTEFANAV